MSGPATFGPQSPTKSTPATNEVGPLGLTFAWNFSSRKKPMFVCSLPAKESFWLWVSPRTGMTPIQESMDLPRMPQVVRAPPPHNTRAGRAPGRQRRASAPSAPNITTRHAPTSTRPPRHASFRTRLGIGERSTHDSSQRNSILSTVLGGPGGITRHASVPPPAMVAVGSPVHHQSPPASIQLYSPTSHMQNPSPPRVVTIRTPSAPSRSDGSYDSR